MLQDAAFSKNSRHFRNLKVYLFSAYLYRRYVVSNGKHYSQVKTRLQKKQIITHIAEPVNLVYVGRNSRYFLYTRNLRRQPILYTNCPYKRELELKLSAKHLYPAII